MRTRADLNAGGAPARGQTGRPLARLAADLQWAASQARGVVERRTTIPRSETATNTPDRCSLLLPRRRVHMAMRDGVRLAADVFEPKPQQRRPVVLIRMPYGVRAHPFMAARGKYWARKGYTCVIQDVRGRGASEGTWRPIVNEAGDGWDTLEWIVRQPWCDGRIGMVGESYYGMTQWAVAPLGHPALRCIAPGNTSTDLYDFVHPGGALAQTTAGAWAWEMHGRRTLNAHRFDPWHLPLITADEAAGRRSTQYKDYIRHWRRDRFWTGQCLDAGLAALTVPVFHWSGWHDIMLAGILAGWSGVQRSCRDARVRERQWLTVAGTDHSLTAMATGRIGRYPASPHVWSFDRVQRFVDRWLGDEDNGQERDAPVRLYVSGRDEWREEESWPPASARRLTLHLHSRGRAATDPRDGALSTEPPDAEPADQYRYDPADPAAWWLGHSPYGIQEHLGDRRALERRRDVLTYTSAPIATGLEVVGPVHARLSIQSSCPDTDFTVALVDVFPDGHVQLVQEGIQRARFRESREHESFLVPGATVPVTVDVAATAHYFGPGHRLRVEVSSSSFGRWDRNLNSGRPLGTDTEIQVAHNAIMHERGAASAVDLFVTMADPSMGAA